MGVEQEFLRSYPAAILSYKKAVNFAEKHLGPEDGITANLRNVYENARSELDMALTKKGKGKKAGKAGKSKKGPKEEFAGMLTPRNVSKGAYLKRKTAWSKSTKKRKAAK